VLLRGLGGLVCVRAAPAARDKALAAAEHGSTAARQHTSSQHACGLHLVRTTTTTRQDFAAKFLSRCHLECLIMGNVTAAEAAAMCRGVAATINASAIAAATSSTTTTSSSSSSRLCLAASERPRERCVQLQGGVSLLHTAPARNADEDNCCVEVYYQVRVRPECAH
jgi:secreted Zn-dependent insulinase-like peptidase